MDLAEDLHAEGAWVLSHSPIAEAMSRARRLVKSKEAGQEAGWPETSKGKSIA